MTEEVKSEVVDAEPVSKIPEAQFAFIVVASSNGFSVRGLDEEDNVPAPGNLDDVFIACNTICRNIDRQLTAETVGQAMMAAASQAQQHASQQKGSKVHVPPYGVRGGKKIH